MLVQRLWSVWVRAEAKQVWIIDDYLQHLTNEETFNRRYTVRAATIRTLKIALNDTHKVVLLREKRLLYILRFTNFFIILGESRANKSIESLTKVLYDISRFE